MLKKGEKKIPINEKGNIFEYDKMGRQSVIEDLSKLIEKTSDPVVFSLNSSWGTGKTTFVELWGAYLRKQHKIQNFYFSAWENDFSKDPLVTILGEFQRYIKKSEIKGAEKSFDKAKEAVSKLLKNAFAASVQKATGGIVDRSLLIELIDEYPAQKDALEEFKGSIKSVLENIDSKPFVIFIDELDRCRPLYAIECLERIKHLFGIDGLVFILSMDKKQLSESIKSQYGNIDANQYLKRFIDIEYTLKNDNTKKFCHRQFEIFELNELLSESKYYDTDLEKISCVEDISPEKFTEGLIKTFDISLRETKQIFLKLDILMKITEEKDGTLYFFYFRIYSFLEILKAHDSSLYYDLVNKDNKETKNKIKNMFHWIRAHNLFNFSMINLIVDATALNKENFQYLKDNYAYQHKKDYEHKEESFRENNIYYQIMYYITYIAVNFDLDADNHEPPESHRGFNDMIKIAIRKIEKLTGRINLDDSAK